MRLMFPRQPPPWTVTPSLVAVEIDRHWHCAWLKVDPQGLRVLTYPVWFLRRYLERDPSPGAGGVLADLVKQPWPTLPLAVVDVCMCFHKQVAGAVDN